MCAGHGQGSQDWADQAGAGLQAGNRAQRGGPPPAACQQQAHARAPCHQAGTLIHPLMHAYMPSDHSSLMRQGMTLWALVLHVVV